MIMVQTKTDIIVSKMGRGVSVLRKAVKVLNTLTSVTARLLLCGLVQCVNERDV